MPALFTPLQLGGIELANRIVVSPMSQYSAEDGAVTDWHTLHYGGLSNSGAGLVVIESTHINAQSRGTPACLGLYTDEQQAVLQTLLATCRHRGSSKFGVQLNHSGRKASQTLPWAKVRGPLPADEGAWTTVSASALPFGNGYPVPHEPSVEELQTIKADYVASAKRALAVGFDVLEIHAAHGYFLHSFLSPLANKRDDQYGGSLENRMRYPLEVFEAVRAVWPRDLALGVKVSSTDWDEKGAGIDEAIAFVTELRSAGCDYVCMSSGATTADTKVPVAPGYQTQFAAAVKQAVDIPVWAVGLIYEPVEADRLIERGEADAVAVGRAFLDNPHWAWGAANALGADVARPRPYLRAAPQVWPGAKSARS